LAKIAKNSDHGIDHKSGSIMKISNLWFKNVTAFACGILFCLGLQKMVGMDQNRLLQGLDNLQVSVCQIGPQAD
jgi:hypothetical protein